MKKQFISGMTGTLVAGAIVMLSGCGGQEQTAQNSESGSASSTGAPESGVELTGAGATFPYPIYAKWFDAYKTAKGTAVNYQSIGSGAGIKQLKNKTVDFGASDAPLKDKDLEEMPSEVVHIPTVAGAVVLAYNLPDVKGLKLDGPTVADIFLGKIKKWNDTKIAALNAGLKLPDTAISVAHRSDGSGTTFLFTTYLEMVSPEWKSKVGSGKSVNWTVGLGGKGNDGVTGVVKQAPGGIGYVELAYALDNGLSYASVKNKAGKFIEPSSESTTAAAKGALEAVKKDVRAPIMNAAGAEAYPIAGFTYILAYKKMEDADKAKALKDLLHWAMKDGEKMASELHYAPLPDELVAINEKTIDSIQ